jgi:hypothetical protein
MWVAADPSRGPFPVMPRESGASSNHGEACGYWIARRSLLPRKRERAMTTSTACDRVVEVIASARSWLN